MKYLEELHTTDPVLAADVAAIRAQMVGVQALFTRPDTRYLIQRARTGQLTHDEREHLAGLRQLARGQLEMAAIVQAELDRDRPAPVRWLRRTLRRFRR